MSGVPPVSADVETLLLAATSRSTQATYATAVRHYKEWCARWGFDSHPLAVTTARALEWLAFAGPERKLMATSLLTYRSALSTAWANAGGTGANPVQDASISRLLAGYRNQRYARDVEARAQRQETIALTVELLAEIEPSAPGARGGTPDDIMLWAAACMLTFGLNRCGEIFRSTRSGRPPIFACAIKFFDHQHASIVRELNSGNWQDAAAPSLYSVALGQTKADREGSNPDQRIAAVPAVRALWRWMHIRRDLGGESGAPLFAVPGELPLTRTRLFAAVASWLGAVSGAAVAPKVTGKAFRRGGNQSLVASGAAISELQHAGRWRGRTMPAVYSSAAADSARGIHVSRGLGELYASAAAACQR